MIKIREEDLNSARIDRLFKLMDQFKRGLVQLNDFKRMLTEDMGRQINMTILGGKTFHGKTSFDWIINAKQQIGLVLSRNFSSLKESFEGSKEFFLIILNFNINQRNIGAFKKNTLLPVRKMG